MLPILKIKPTQIGLLLKVCVMLACVFGVKQIKAQPNQFIGEPRMNPQVLKVPGKPAQLPNETVYVEYHPYIGSTIQTVAYLQKYPDYNLQPYSIYIIPPTDFEEQNGMYALAYLLRVVGGDVFGFFCHCVN